MATDAAYGMIPVLPVRGETPRRYLLILHHKGHWGFPKGHKDGDDETDLQAALRELREETGLDGVPVVPEISLRESYQFVTREGISIEKTVTYFVAPLTDSDPPMIQIQAAELADYGWYTFAESLERITFEASRGILRQCEDYLNQFHLTP
jgi:8-oxo-dGTP pyrophosphatase MutT (NUDIX family)